MIQRIQSIFLLLGGGAFLSLLALPFATTAKPVATSAFFADSAYTIQDNIGLMVLFIGAGALAIIGIFMFNNRQLQMRLTIFSAIAAIIGIVLTVLFFLQNSNSAGNQPINDGLGVYLTPVGLALIFLAYRFINKDDQTVKSMDRLR
jgi:peptidoglycan/LPS O-acetylase OafA/YrhL